MLNYLKHVRKEINKLTFQSQGLAWFIAFKISYFILPNLGNNGLYLFNLILNFMLSMILMTLGVWVSDLILKGKDSNNNF
ncbi:hypothetical protein A5821_002172 [Enterococcus sp. 7F3_DIV0205]|uniref:Uncharacterized protein n=1 Tax=Candidatus Enterococcus palustris TaxID=1834189 RepID=A0AAQ3Y7X9_9ENTE|nr:hypothetical protein A5821_002522 [Enterococcus sp. 7F3_DIV0205]